MAIGTTVKVGFDGTAVKQGLAGMTGMFRRFGGMLGGLGKQVGIGALRQGGVMAADLLTRLVTAVPEGIKETMDWAGNLTDMSAQAGVSVSKLVLMEEALRLAGASAKDTSMMLSRLKDNLYEAEKEAGPAREALMKLGLFLPDYKDLKIDDAFELIGRQVSQLPNDFEGLESIMADLFGARMGYKMIRFFRDFEGGMRQAENNVGVFARRLDATAGGYDKMSDALGRFQMRWRETMSIIIDQVTGLFGDDWVDQLFDFMSPEKLRQTIVYLREQISSLFTGDLLKNSLKEAGRMIGEGIRESLGMDKGIMGLFSQSSATPRGGEKLSPMMASIEANTRMTTDMLRHIYRNPKPAVAA